MLAIYNHRAYLCHFSIEDYCPQRIVYFHGRGRNDSAALPGLRPARSANARSNKPARGRTAIASYVATLSADLAAMARDTGLDTLGYLLEMVRREAKSSVRQNSGRTDGARHLLNRYAQLYQKHCRWVAIRHHAELFLFGADVVAQIEVNVAFEVGDLITERR
jgi:hypothetical protein